MAFASTCIPLTLVLSLLLAARAGAQPAEVAGERQVVLSSDPRAPVPVLRVPPAGTVLRFLDARILPDSVALEGQRTRVELFDRGERSLTLVPVRPLEPRERLRLVVRFEGDSLPTQAAFDLIAGSPETDLRVAVVRRAKPLETEVAELRARLAEKEEALQALQSRAGATDPVGLVLASVVDEDGLEGLRLMPTGSEGAELGLKVPRARGFRSSKWMAVVLTVENSGRTPWSPVGATLTSTTTGERVQVLALGMNPAELGAGETRLLVIECGVPSPGVGRTFRLVVRGEAGNQRLLVYTFTIQPGRQDE